MFVTALFLAACGNDFSATKQSVCDGVAQASEETVDAPFDADGDGAFDAANPQCIETYGIENLDCDDGNPDVRPGKPELPCNDYDDDCDATTIDSEDLDSDGANSCIDCNDADAAMSPGFVEVACNAIDDDCDATTEDATDADGDGVAACAGDCDDMNSARKPGNAEVCDNGVDEDCDGTVDEDCTPDSYTDTWELDDVARYSCAFGVISIDFGELTVIDDNPDISFVSGGRGSQPGTMTGSFTGATTVEAERVVTGACTEVYTLVGEFVSDIEFHGTFTAEFVGGRSACFDCSNQSWDIVARR